MFTDKIVQSSFFDIKTEENILDKYEINQELKINIIPTFEIFFNYTNGYGIYACEDIDEKTFNIQGCFVKPLILGQSYCAEGTIATYKGEKQIKVKKIYNIKPCTKKGIIAYLKTLNGLKTKAEWIYDKFGQDSIEMLRKDPMFVAKSIKGIGKKSVISWKEQLEKMKDLEIVLTNLLGFGLSPSSAKNLYEKYGDSIVSSIEENPFILAREVKGYGFDKCDKIARSIGHNPKSEYRIQEGLIYILENAQNEGHCFLPKDKLIENACDLLSIKIDFYEIKNLIKCNTNKDIVEYELNGKVYQIKYSDLCECVNKNDSNKYKNKDYRYVLIELIEDDITQQISKLKEDSRIIIDDDRVYLPYLYNAEVNVSKKIKEIISHKKNIDIDLKDKLNLIKKKMGIQLEVEQEEATIKFCSTKGGFYILNGSAGCGKTFTLNIILELLEDLHKNYKIMIFAPTGKAAKVANIATGRECKTIHRGLEYNPFEGFTYNEYNPLKADCIVVDESSMLDIELINYLLNAVTPETKIIFLGDTKQLPSVGAGNVLHDLIDSGIIDITTLSVIKRQTLDSGIIKNANNIIEGNMIENCNDTNDFYIIEKEEPFNAINTILESVKRLISNYNYTLDDIQILCPQKKGIIGAHYLNYKLQTEFNNSNSLSVINKNIDIKLSPSDRANTKLQLDFKVGDKVIHTKNNYDISWYKKVDDEYKKTEQSGVFNGDSGEIIDIYRNTETKDIEIVVKYDDKLIIYDSSNKIELEHAYALTIHKSQGSQWKCIIIPMMTQNYIMLENNLLYTGITRAQEKVIIVGQKTAISHAIKTHKLRNRYTYLSNRLKKA